MSSQPNKTLTVKLVKSAIGYPERQKRTLKALGFSRLGESVQHPDNAAVRGMIRAVVHLVEVSES
jgi:large subunit ribosomal protein L30